MLAQQSAVSGAGVLGCRKQASCRQSVIRAQQVVTKSSTSCYQRSCNIMQNSSRRSVLLGAGVAVGLLLAPAAAQAKLVDLNRQRREQEMMYAPQMKKLDEMMMEQMRAKQAESGGKSLGASARSARRREFQAE